MKKVRYKDQYREFEMPADTFEKTFKKEALMELVRTGRANGILPRFANYIKTLPFIVRIIAWLKT